MLKPPGVIFVAEKIKIEPRRGVISIDEKENILKLR